MHEAPEIETPNHPDTPNATGSKKTKPFDAERAAKVLLAIIGPNSPFPDQDMLKVYPCK